MDNFQHNWPPFLRLHLLLSPLHRVFISSLCHTVGVTYLDICYHGSKRPLLECFITCWGWAGLSIRPLSLSVCLFNASTSALRRLKASEFEVCVRCVLPLISFIQSDMRALETNACYIWFGIQKEGNRLHLFVSSRVGSINSIKEVNITPKSDEGNQCRCQILFFYVYMWPQGKVLLISLDY